MSASILGDGVLAYFGYPRADEHDAERAVRAGLALVEAVAAPGRPPARAAVPGVDTAAGVPLQVRVGIATGLVVVGDLPRVRGLTLMVNSIFNGNRFEDLRIEE